MEAATGATKANVTFESNGDTFFACEAPDFDEQSAMMVGPTYLALLSSELYSPNNRRGYL